MNCKPGDLAVIVRSSNGNEGRFLRCIRLASYDEASYQSIAWWMMHGPVWVTDSKLPCTDGSFTNLYPDDRLRPIRDNDGEDEMLRIAGKPEVTHA